MARLEIVVDAELNRRSPGSFPCADDGTRCDDDRELVAEMPDPPGFSRHGLDDVAVTAKFNAITAAASRMPHRGRASSMPR